jgi:hypothetical protein
MELMMPPLVWAQAQPGAASPNSIALLALRRWFSSLTLSSPQAVPGYHGLWALLAGLGFLLVVCSLFQGPGAALKQLFDLPGHVRLVQLATRRVWRAGRMISIAIGFTVLSWTASQSLAFVRESGRRLDLSSLTKSRRLGELAAEQGILAGLTPLRDVAGLGDNLPLLTFAAILLFKASLDLPGWGSRPDRDFGVPIARRRSGWTTLAWGTALLYALYRAVACAAGSSDLPLGGCLVAEAVLVPILMVISDGFLMAWLLTELRDAGFDNVGEDRLDLREAIVLLPASALACALALPARYIATFVFLASTYLPTWSHATSLGQIVRWHLAGWGLTDIQAAALLVSGAAGAVAWSTGSLQGSITGYRRLLVAQGGHLIAALAMAATAAGVLAAAVYAIVLLLPAQGWVLGAADSYAHYATLPVGLWTLAALIELAQRSLPTAALCQSSAGNAPAFSHTGPDRFNLHEGDPTVVAPGS